MGSNRTTANGRSEAVAIELSERQVYVRKQPTDESELMRYLLLHLFVFLVTDANAESLPLPGTPPIDSEEEALFVAETEVFRLQSCVSKEFRTTVEEFEEYWKVTSEDLDPVGVRPCRKVTALICKESGKIIFDQASEECPK